MKVSDLGFAFDLACALIYIVAVPLLLVFLFGPAIAKGIQKMQAQRNGKISPSEKKNRKRTSFGKVANRKNKCPHCKFINDAQEEYCTKCGARLKISGP